MGGLGIIHCVAITLVFSIVKCHTSWVSYSVPSAGLQAAVANPPCLRGFLWLFSASIWEHGARIAGEGRGKNRSLGRLPPSSAHSSPTHHLSDSPPQQPLPAALMPSNTYLPPFLYGSPVHLCQALFCFSGAGDRLNFRLPSYCCLWAEENLLLFCTLARNIANKAMENWAMINVNGVESSSLTWVETQEVYLSVCLLRETRDFQSQCKSMIRFFCFFLGK